ncbi:MAG: DUF2897 family protein [Pseudomonadota bacterium]|nr:DUF2897 family protein [Pseudomonadota bacterium]
MKAIIIIIVVVGALIGGLLTLRSTRGAGMPGKDVMDRAKERAREQAAKDETDSDR